MNNIHRALTAHPAAPEVPTGERSAEAECMEACLEAAQVGLVAADACLDEPDVAQLRECARTQQDCAAVAAATAAVLARRGFPQPGDGHAVLLPLLEACRGAGAACAEASGRHAETYEHCAVAAEAARRCERACAALLARRG